MKMSPPCSPFIDIATEFILPSWGDPILPQDLEVSNEDLFSSPLSSNEWLSSEDENECFPTIMKDPRLESEMTSLINSATRSSQYAHRTSREFNDFDSIVMQRDDDVCCEREGNSTTRCLVDGSFRAGPIYSLALGSLSQDTEMEIDDEETSIQSSVVVYSFFHTEWSVEIFYFNNALSFKLRTSTGACMQLMSDEIIDSLKALVEDAMETQIKFRIVQVDGQIVYVDWTLVIPMVTKILKGYNTKLSPQIGMESALQRMDLDVKKAIKVEMRPTKRSGFGVPTLSRRQAKNCVANPKYRRQIGSAWKVISKRAKIRPRPGTRME